MAIEIEIDCTVETGIDKTLDPKLGDNHRTDVYYVDMTVGEKAIDIKIMIIDVTVEIEGTSVMTEVIGIGAEQEKEL